MERKKAFLLYCDYLEQLNMLSDEQAGKLFRALLVFAADGTEPQIDDGMILMAFSFIAGQIRRDTEKYDETCQRRAESGKRGGRPKEKTVSDEKANGFSEKQKKQMVSEKSKKSKWFFEKAKKPDNEYVYDNENDNVDDTVCVYDTCAPDGAQEPTHTLQQISALLSALGYDWPEEEVGDFFEYNQRLGWKFRPETAARRWDRRRMYQTAFGRGRQTAPAMTPEEIEEMNDYLSVVNHFAEED